MNYKLPKIVLKDRMTRNWMYIPYTFSFIDLYKYRYLCINTDLHKQCKEHSHTFDIPTQPQSYFWCINPTYSFLRYKTVLLLLWPFEVPPILDVGTLDALKTLKQQSLLLSKYNPRRGAFNSSSRLGKNRLLALCVFSLWTWN